MDDPRIARLAELRRAFTATIQLQGKASCQHEWEMAQEQLKVLAPQIQVLETPIVMVIDA